jgi:acetylglutamate kinase
MDIAVAVLTGLVNKSIVASLLALGGRAVGLSGVDGGLLRARITEPELGLVGGVVVVDPRPIAALVEAGYIPVISPVSVHDPQGPDAPDAPLLNVNADTAAGEIAGAIAAESLVFMTDVDGVLDSSRRRIPRLTARQARGLMRSSVIDGGMIPKIGACLKALNEVSSAHIVDGRHSHALINSLSGVPLGTRVG